MFGRRDGSFGASAPGALLPSSPTPTHSATPPSPAPSLAGHRFSLPRSGRGRTVNPAKRLPYLSSPHLYPACPELRRELRRARAVQRPCGHSCRHSLRSFAIHTTSVHTPLYKNQAQALPRQPLAHYTQKYRDARPLDFWRATHRVFQLCNLELFNFLPLLLFLQPRAKERSASPSPSAIYSLFAKTPGYSPQQSLPRSAFLSFAPERSHLLFFQSPAHSSRVYPGCPPAEEGLPAEERHLEALPTFRRFNVATFRPRLARSQV
jgi:hypothetical protein